MLLHSRVLFSGCKIQRENLWLVVGCKYTNQRFSLRILQPEKITLLHRIFLEFEGRIIFFD
jgi:hypothetical protein